MGGSSSRPFDQKPNGETRKEKPMRNVSIVAAAVLGVAFAAPAVAQDAAKVDAKHYKVEFENDRVRVLRVTYGPKEKSVMHEHSNAVEVFLTDAKVKCNLSDGKSKE